MLSIDATIADRESQSYKRIQQQAGLVEELVVFIVKKGKEYRIKDGNLSIWSSPFLGKVFSMIWAYNKARDIIKEKNIEVITAQDPFFLGSLVRILANSFKIGYEIQIHGDFFSNDFWRNEIWFNKLLLNLGLRNLKNAGSVRVVSERVKNDLIRRGVSEERIIKIPIFVDWQKIANSGASFNLKEKYPQFKFIALSLGRLEKVKNIDLLLWAWRDFLENNPSAGLIIVGDGAEEAILKQLANDINLIDSVIFEPATKDVVSYYRGADCFVLTSYYEGWGRTIVEAMACGCPIIMTDVGCAGELVKDGESGVIVERNKEALSDALNHFMDGKRNDEFVQNAYKSLELLPDKEKTKELYLRSWKKAKR